MVKETVIKKTLLMKSNVENRTVSTYTLVKAVGMEYAEEENI